MVMSRTDLGRWSAARVEIDHRAREARRQLEHLERVLLMRALPTQPWMKWLLYRRGVHLFNGERVPSRSNETDPAGAERRELRHILNEIFGATTERAVSAKAAIGGMARGPSTA
jgi:hypothetical protein